MRVKVKVTQSYLTLCDPMGYTVHGILQARILEWVAYLFSRDLPIQESNWDLLHCRQILYQLSYQGVQETMPFGATQMELEIIILSKVKSDRERRISRVF